MKINCINLNLNRTIVKAYYEGRLTDTEFCTFVTDLLISKNGYITDCCNAEQGNAKALLLLVEKIRKHPFIWKMFFSIA